MTSGAGFAADECRYAGRSSPAKRCQLVNAARQQRPDQNAKANQQRDDGKNNKDRPSGAGALRLCGRGRLRTLWRPPIVRLSTAPAKPGSCQDYDPLEIAFGQFDTTTRL